MLKPTAPETNPPECIGAPGGLSVGRMKETDQFKSLASRTQMMFPEKSRNAIGPISEE